MAAVVKKCDCADTRRCKHSWVVRYRASGRQRERSFRHDQKTTANDFALKVEHDKKAGVFIDSKLGDVTVSEWCERWIRQHRGADNSRAVCGTVLNKHIKPAIGDMQLRRVTREHVQDLLLEMMPKTVGHAVMTFRIFPLRAGRLPARPGSPRRRVQGPGGGGLLLAP